MDFDSAYRETIERIFAEDLPGFIEAKAFCLGDGKRLRPLLLIDAGLVWGADSEASRTAGVGIELLHQYLLVHDDLMDGDELRHDQPTVHASTISKYGTQMGTGIAILIGDHLANEGMQMLSLASRDFALNAELVRATSGIIRETILGQTREYIPNTDWTIFDLENFYAYKTAAYSIRLPWMIADLLAGKKQERESAISRASRNLGIAYQFHDDLIEFTGAKKRNANGGGGDIARGKMTIVSRLILDVLPVQERKELLDQWKTGEPLSSEAMKKLRAFAETEKIPVKIQGMINARIADAIGDLNILGLSDTPSVKTLLNYLNK